MEVEEIQTQPCKFSRVGNGRNDSTKSAQKLVEHSYQEDEDEQKKTNLSGTGPAGSNRLRGWHHSSRIIRVSRASGGKDRHSKVWTSKGPRDRRVRLSVTTAIEFYDLQDRLGYDQPSKAVEWLIKAAADSIAELPSLNSSFPSTPKQLNDEKGGSDVGNEQGFDSADLELEDPGFNNQNQNQQHMSLSKSACSSTSETSKGSGLSLSRSDMRENRFKARERARKRAAKEKEKENESRIGQQQHQTLHPISQSSTFTELLTAGIGSVSNNSISNNDNANTNAATSPGSEPSFFQKRQWPLTTSMDYFNGFLGASSSRTTHQSSGYSEHIQLGHSIPQNMTMTMSIPPFNAAAENHNRHQQEQQQFHNFPFVSDHLMSVATTAQPGPTVDYNLNFTISSGLAGFNRGTLQSNSTPSPSLLPHLQRFTSWPIDGNNVNVPLFISAAPAVPLENHHHHHQFPPGLQLCYSDGSRHSDKSKGKN